MTSKKKAATAPDPAPDPAPTAVQVSPKITTTFSSFNTSTLDSGNKSPYILTTPTNTPGYHEPKETTPVTAEIFAKPSVPLPFSVIKSTIRHV